MRAIDPAHFPNVVTALREAGVDPATRADPGGAGGPLHDGRDRHRPRRALDARRASTRSASPRAPACTAPTASPRTRSASASCSRAAPSPHALSAARTRPGPGPASRDRRRCARCPRRRRRRAATREALWRAAGIVRTPEGLRRPARGPAPAGAADRALRARAHGEPRRAPAHRPSAARPRARPPPRRRDRRAVHRLADLALSAPDRDGVSLGGSGRSLTGLSAGP